MVIVDLETSYSGDKLQSRLERERRHWNRGIKSKMGRHVKKLLQSQPENNEGLNYGSSNGTGEKRINWAGKTGVNKCGEDKENKKSPKIFSRQQLIARLIALHKVKKNVELLKKVWKKVRLKLDFE